MSQSLLVIVSEAALIILICVGIFVVLSASIYDFNLLARRRSLKSAVAKLRKPRQPHVTVLVYTRNNASTLAACLRSVERSYYHHYDVVVVDNKSTDDTRQVVEHYRQRHAASKLYYYRKRKENDQVTALHQGYKKSQHGDMVLVLAASATIAPTLLKASVARLTAAGRVGAIRLSERGGDVTQLVELLPRFVQLGRMLISRSMSISHLSRARVGEANVLYLVSTFRHRSVACRYAGDLVVSVADGVGHSVELPIRSQLLLYISWFLGVVFVVCLMTYYMYIAATLQSSSLLIISWTALSFWFLAAIWADETTRLPEKIARTVCTPVLYLLVYVKLVVLIGTAGRRRVLP